MSMNSSCDDIMAFLESIKPMCTGDVAEHQREISSKALYLKLGVYVTESRIQELELEIEAMHNTHKALQIENDKISKLLQDSKHQERIINKRFQTLETEFVQAQEIACRKIQMIQNESKKSLSMMKQDNANVRERHYNLLENYNKLYSMHEQSE